MASSKYDSHVLPKLEQIDTWAKEGLSDKQIAGKLGIAYSTFRRYRDENEALSAALACAKEVPDTEVENALYKKALGYNAEIVKHYKLKSVEYDPDTGKKCKETEELVAVKDEVHVPADTTAQMFWLVNRRSERWSYKPNAGEEAEDEETGVIVLAPMIAPEREAADG